MNRFVRGVGALMMLAFFVGSNGALADKPAHAGGGKDKDKGSKHENKGDDSGYSTSVSVGGVSIRIGDSDRRAISDYYQGQAKAGKCPPGLAKKNNGCQPPGQAKKWARGKPIGDLDVHELPYDLRIRLPAPPSGHRYVQVAADVLLIAVGTGIVVDAVEDLLR